MGRGRWLVAAAAAVVSAVACVDLFHSTATQTLCEVDASACVEAGIDLCDAGDPQANALHACAWLSACVHPVGRNMTGPCIADALLAFDCTANPSRPARGKAKDFWTCMLGVKTCSDVEACVFPQRQAGCSNGGFLGCSQTAANADTRFDCTVKTIDSGLLTPGENCAMSGQTCDALDPDASNRNALCVGPARRNCQVSACVDGGVSVCDDAGIDHGYDCNDVGAQQCNAGGASPACAPVDIGLGNCQGVATSDVTCDPSFRFAKGCVTGVAEKVDCLNLGGSCIPIEGGPGTVPSDGCFAADAGCDADLCDQEGGVSACVRGRPVSVPCTALGLGACDLIVTGESGDAGVASCTPPL